MKNEFLTLEDLNLQGLSTSELSKVLGGTDGSGDWSSSSSASISLSSSSSVDSDSDTESDSEEAN